MIRIMQRAKPHRVGVQHSQVPYAGYRALHNRLRGKGIRKDDGGSSCNDIGSINVRVFFMPVGRAGIYKFYKLLH
jgi:hypothetical protein